MSDSVRPHRRQPTRFHRPWDSPGKNTGVGCHFLFQCVKVKSLSRNPMDCNPPGSSVHGIFEARALEWGAIAFSKRTNVSTLLFAECHTLVRFHRLFPNVLFLLQDPIQDTSYVWLPHLLRLLWVMTVPQSFVVFNELDNSEEY